jgi:hypothetical protein
LAVKIKEWVFTLSGQKQSIEHFIHQTLPIIHAELKVLNIDYSANYSSLANEINTEATLILQIPKHQMKIVRQTCIFNMLELREFDDSNAFLKILKGVSPIGGYVSATETVTFAYIYHGNESLGLANIFSPPNIIIIVGSALLAMILDYYMNHKNKSNIIINRIS